MARRRDVVLAAKKAPAARADYEAAYGAWVDVARRKAALELQVHAGPNLVTVGGPLVSRSATTAKSEAQRLEEGELIAAREKMNRRHAAWCGARDAYEAAVAAARSRVGRL